MTTREVCAASLIALPILFNLFFFLLDRQFEYPDILRKPVDHVLQRFADGGSALKITWLGFTLTAVLFAPTVVLLHEVLAPGATALLAVATTLGVLAAIVQFLGLVRWPFLVPYLARTYQDPTRPRRPRQPRPSCSSLSTDTRASPSVSTSGISSPDAGPRSSASSSSTRPSSRYGSAWSASCSASHLWSECLLLVTEAVTSGDRLRATRCTQRHQME